ncbi:MAG TPA: NAD(+) diphosphatase [Syntrophorhabdaceae bacterium]|nr:NAD(+) diphosphatase [Syntrophorhabdaceae bacterium]
MKDSPISSDSPPFKEDPSAWWFVFRDQKMLVAVEKSAPEVPSSDALFGLGLIPLTEYHLGILDGTRCIAAYLPENVAVPAHMEFHGLRSLFGHLNPEFYAIAVRALGIINWDSTHEFCSQCGSPALRRNDVLARQCTKCGFTMFPRISPAVIVLVERDDKALLARATRFQDAMYSVIAGFVEPGETLEQTVQREVKEETGIEVDNIHYFGSQPWPFPDSLMIGFTAQYAGGEIKVDGEELLDAAWFAADGLPRIPGRISIARALIDWFVAKHGKAVGDE